MEQQTRRRRRPALSCIACRRRKIKCDRVHPCKNCMSTKAQCDYERDGFEAITRRQGQEDNLQGLRPSPLSVEGEQSNHHLNPQEVATTADLYDFVSPLDHANRRSPDRSSITNSDFQGVLQRLNALEESSRSGGKPARSGSDALARQLRLQDSQIILNKTRIFRWSHWMGSAEEFAPIMAFFAEVTAQANSSSFSDSETTALVGQMSDLLRECKYIAKSIKLGRPEVFLSPDFVLATPSREVADAAAMLYFRSFESIHRILHEPTFWDDYEKYWSSPESVTPDLRIQILLVIGIGSSIAEHAGADPIHRNMVHQWIYAAQTWLSEPLKKSRLDIAGVQVHCLTILARQIFSVGGDLVWVSTGSLIHRAMQMGLHRDPTHLSGMSVLQTELRRRLWATVLEIVTQTSLDSAMTTMISFDEFDTKEPSNVNDSEITESATVARPHGRTTYTTTSLQLLLLKSLPTRLRIVKLLNGLQSKISYSDILALTSELDEAFIACKKFVKENQESGITPFHSNLLYYLMRRFMIPLHCQFAAMARTNPLFHYSINACLDTAMATIFPEPDESFARLMNIGGGLFREGMRVAVTVISLEILIQVKLQRLGSMMLQTSQHRNMFKQALEDAISYSYERIRQGETNIKTPMFLNMVLAQAAAVKEGIPGDLKMAQSARDSLELCCQLLRKRADGTFLPQPNDARLTPTSTDYRSEELGLDLDLDFFFPDGTFS